MNPLHASLTPSSPVRMSHLSNRWASGEVRHLVAKTLVDHTPMLQGLVTRSRDFH